MWNLFAKAKRLRFDWLEGLFVVSKIFGAQYSLKIPLGPTDGLLLLSQA